MPNVTIYMPAEKMPSDITLSALTQQCTEFCTGCLRAKLANVHVIYVGVQHGRGHPVFVDVRYRLEPFRTPQVMEEFMTGLEDSIRQETGLAARIRCFGYAPSSIHGRN